MGTLLKSHPRAGFSYFKSGSSRRVGLFLPFGSTGGDGFTLIELLIVMSIIGILATLAVPSYRMSVLKAKEATLKRDLFVFRDSIDQFRADQGRYPSSLNELVEKEYLRAIPVDPFTQSADTWVDLPAPEGTDSGVFDVHSGSDLVGTNNVPYNQW